MPAFHDILAKLPSTIVAALSLFVAGTLHSNAAREMYGFGERTLPSTEFNLRRISPFSPEYLKQKESQNPAATTDSDDNGGDNNKDGGGNDSNVRDNNGAKPTPANNKPTSKVATKPPPRKIDYTTISKHPEVWPKAVRIRTAGSRVIISDDDLQPIGKVVLPVGTRVFVLKVARNGILTVRSESGLTFNIHATRTTFSNFYPRTPATTTPEYISRKDLFF